MNFAKFLRTLDLLCKSIDWFLYEGNTGIKWVKTWDAMKISYELNNKSYFKQRQIVNSIPKTWKKVLKESQGYNSNLLLLDHQLLKNNRTLRIDKMNSKEIYSVIISLFILSKVNIPTHQFILKKNPLYNNGKTFTHFRSKSL